RGPRATVMEGVKDPEVLLVEACGSHAVNGRQLAKQIVLPIGEPLRLRLHLSGGQLPVAIAELVLTDGLDQLVETLAGRDEVRVIRVTQVESHVVEVLERPA